MSMNAPANWLPANFDEVFSQVSTSGKKVKTADVLAEGKFPVVDQGRTFISGYLDNAQLVVADDKPLIIFGDHTREIKWIDFPFIPGADGVQVLKPHPEMEARFLYYFLRNLPIESKGYARHFKIVKDATYLVPPLAEQTRIAQKLDELLAQVDTLKARIDAIPALLKRFRQSVLAAAVSGRLTEEWRASSVPEASCEHQSVDVLEPWSHTIEAPVSWQIHIFEEVIKLVGGSQPPKSEFAYEQKPGFVRLIQIRDYKSDSHKVFINQESTKKFCDKHDVMIGRYGPPIFQILRGLEGAYNVALMKAVPLEGLDNEYMYWYLQNYKLLNFVEAGSDRTAGQSGVNKAFLEKYPLFMPPLDEQTEIVRRIEQLFAFADQLEAKVATAQARIDRLTQSILAKAFRGELVPQDPNDEPASVLLERIKAQRATAPKAKRGRKASA
jgi:type I restriction enzyme S subunit